MHCGALGASAAEEDGVDSEEVSSVGLPPLESVGGAQVLLPIRTYTAVLPVWVCQLDIFPSLLCEFCQD